MVERLIAFWQEFIGPEGQGQYRFVHPSDRKNVDTFCAARPPFEVQGPIGEASWAEYVANWYGDEHVGRRPDLLELSLLPHPYSGDLRNASVFVLSLNGGASDSWYRELHLDEARRAQYLAELCQGGPNWNHRHAGFDVANCGTSAFSYWGERNYQLANAIAVSTGQNLGQAYDFMARGIATLELIAYPSRNTGDIEGLIPNISPQFQRSLDTLAPGALREVEFDPGLDWGSCALPSGVRMLSALWNELVPGALQGGKTIIVTRAARRWGFGQFWKRACANIIVYPTHLAQGAHLGPTTMGGQAILERLRQRYAER